jgi:hypothetical protein
MPTVKVFSAGDHFHADPVESSELIELLLNRSGYTKDINWECRIDKMKTCSNAHDRPVKVIGHKPFGVVLRVKPKTHGNVDHQVTLLIPEGSGYSAKNLFDQLKGVEKSINRQWRQQVKEEIKEAAPTLHIPVIKEPIVELPVVENHVVEELKPEEPIRNGPVFKNLKGVCENPEKLKFVLEKIHKLVVLNVFHTKHDFIEGLKKECGWTNQLIRICSRVLSEFIRHEYIIEVINERNKIIGYEITRKGLALINGGIKLPEIKPTPEPTIMDFAKALVEYQEKARELADVGAKLAVNNTKKQELQQEIDKIDKENAELTKVISHNRETYELLKKVMQNINVLSLES